MQHNELAAMFRNELTNRNIDITIEEWDRVIYNFAEKTFSNRTATIKAIHATIDSTISRKASSFILYPEELEMFKQFKKDHADDCDPRKREAMIEEDCSPVLYSIILGEGGIGVNVLAKCEVCGKLQAIMCAERLDLL
jgi:hypothetical protein